MEGDASARIGVYEAFADELNASRDRYAELEPTAALTAVHDHLVDQLERAASAARAVVASVSQGDGAAVDEHLVSLADALAGIDRARATITSRLAAA